MMAQSTYLINKEKLIQNILNNFPQELLSQPIWLAYYFKQKPDGTYSKPPCTNLGHTVKDDKPGVSFYEACKDGFPGIKINKHTNIIAFDIDDKDAKLGKRKFTLDNISDGFKSFIKWHKSYIELSPSQCGLRMLAVCNNKINLPGRVNLNSELCIGGELFINSGYVTITGQRLTSSKSLAVMVDKDLKQWFETPKKAEVVDIPLEKTRLPSLQLILNALSVCKLNQSEKVKKAYKDIIGQDYNHYDYWIKILASCHHYALLTNQLNDMLIKVIEWSETDEDAFIDDEDVVKHWSSFSNKEQKITYHTLLKFAQLLKFQWPVPALDKKGKLTGKPIITSFENFLYLMNYFNIKIFVDELSSRIYVTADKEIYERYFYSENETFLGMAGPFDLNRIRDKCWFIAQQNGYTAVAPGTLNPIIDSYFREYSQTINTLRLWLETEPRELPEDLIEKNTAVEYSNLDYLLSCIEFAESQDKELVKVFFDTFFFEMMMPVYNTERKYAQRSFMLVLTGPENCRKTTFFSMLFPSSLRQLFVTNSTETLSGSKSIRDFATSLVTSVLVVTDEFEIFYNKNNDSLFKTYVTSDAVDFTPIYEKIPRKAYKNAVLAGTTNKTSLPFEQDSNRRLAMLNVRWIDTSAMEKINWHHFYREYIKRGKEAMKKGEYPWKLSGSIITKQYEANEEFRAQTNLEIVLRQLFDFDLMTHKKPISHDSIKNVQSDTFLYKQSDVLALLKQTNPELRFSLAELKHTLKRMCGHYSRTTNRQLILRNGQGMIESGIVRQSQHVRYLMPPRLTDF